MTQIHSLFRDKITRDINPVVKVQDDNKEHIRQELQEYVITDQIRRHFKEAFKYYQEGSKYCYWISGWFGSGKSHFTKLFGHVLGNYKFENTTSSDIFLSRDESSELRPLVEEIRDKYQTEILMFDILEETAYDSNNQQQSISITIYKQFLAYLGFYSHILWVGELEYDLYEQGIYDQFITEFEKVSGKSWIEVREKPARQKSKIGKTLSRIKPEDFPSDTIALDFINSIQNDFSMSPKRLIEILRSYIEKKPTNGKENRLFLLIDEMGQFMARDDQKISELQGISHQVEVTGKGKVWLGVTAQEQLKEVEEGAIKHHDEIGKLTARFEVKIHLTSENLDSVLYERVLKKTPDAKLILESEFEKYSGKVESVLDFADADRQFAKLTKKYFVKAYPFFPYQLGIIKDIFVKFIQRHDTNKKQGGTNRSMIKTTQGILTNPENHFYEMEVGNFVTLDQVYAEARDSNFVPTTVIDTIDEVEKADPENPEFTKKVLKVLYLLDSVSYLPRTLDNITKLLFNHIEVNFHELRTNVEVSLKKLTKAGFVEREGDIYSFLSPEEQNFRHEVLAEQEEVRTRAISLYVRNLVKETFNQNRVLYKQISLFSIDMYADEEKYDNGKDISFEALSPFILFNDPNLRNKKKNDSITDEKRIYWLAEPNEDIEDMIKEFLARHAAIEKQREKADEERKFFLRKEEQKNQNLAQEIKRKLKASFLSGSYLYRGKEYDLPKGDDVKTIYDSLISIVIPIVYTRFSDVNVKITAAHIDEVFKPNLHSVSSVFKDLNILDNDNQINPSAKVLNEVLAEIKSKNTRFGICTGNDLLDFFGNQPYGWDSLAIRFFSALLFRGGFIELEIKGKALRSYTESGVKEIFEKEPNFKTAQLIEVKNVDPAIRQQCKKILEADFNETVTVDTIPEYYTKTIKVSNELLRQVKGLIVSAKDNNLSVIDSLEKVEEAYEKVIHKNHSSDAIISFVDTYQQLKDQMNIMHKFDKFISNENIKTLKEIKKFINEIWSPQHFPKDDLHERMVLTIQSQLKSDDFLDNWNDIKGYYLQLKSHHDIQYQDLHKKVMKNIEEIMNEIERLPQFHLLDIHQQRKALEPLSKYFESNTANSRYSYDFLVQVGNALPSYKQEAIAIYGDLVNELNRPLNPDPDDGNDDDLPKPVFKQIKLSDYMKTRQISSEREVEEFVKDLENKLKEELRKVDYFILS